MLVLSRRIGEKVIIDENIEVTIVAVHGDRVRLGISAPPAVRVDRLEVHQRRSEFFDTPNPREESEKSPEKSAV